MAAASVSLSLAVLGLGLGSLAAQDTGKTEATPAAEPAAPAADSVAEFEKQSLALRTALHYDPSLDSPLKSLVTLYQNVDRVEELIGVYRGHITQFPDDAGSKAVLIRLLSELNRSEADELAQSAVQVHADDPLLNFLLYEMRARREDPRALDSLARAIDLEQKPARRDAWAEILLEESGDGAGRQLAQAYLEKLKKAPGNTAQTLFALADRMHRYEFNELALATLQDALKGKPDPETGVDIEVLTAKVQAALGDRDAAGLRLDALLGKLAPDYWRRVEIMSLRVGMLSSEADRRRLLAEAKVRYEGNAASESAVLEYAELLAISEKRREAIAVLEQAGDAFPASERIERQMLSLLENLTDQSALEDYLDERVATYPDRADLRYRLVKVLYALGRSADAQPHLEKVLTVLEPAEADRRLLDLARHLRNSNHYQGAAALYRRIIDAQPDRFDVIRELSETHLAMEDRTAARAVLRDLPVADAAIENFLDLVQFMVTEDFLAEAGAALEARLTGSPDSLDLRLELSRVSAKIGDRTRAEKLITESRTLTDTPARYRVWLETALEAHELFGEAATFFDQEQHRLLTEGSIEGDNQWSADRIEKFLTFCELGEEKQLEDRVTQALRNQLADASLPGELRLRLRRLLVKALERTPERAGETEQQLQQLAREDPGRASEYDLRRALLYHNLQRTDLAGEALQKVNVATVDDPKLLKAAYLVFVDYGMLDAARRSLEKITQREPSDFVSWEKRLSLLAAMGEEEELRKAARQLLAGGDRINLGPPSIQSLKLHLLDSLWRSVSRLLAVESAEAFADALPLLDSVDREALDTPDRLWSLWARAYALNGLNRTDARDEVIQQLALAASKTGEAIEEVRIAFPDGLSISLDAAVGLLREPVPRTVAAVTPVTEGPLGESVVAWAFEADPDARILQMTSTGDEAADLLVLDDQGTLYRVDRKTGKLRWRERFGLPSSMTTGSDPNQAGVSAGGITISNAYYQIQQQGGTLSVQQLMAPYQSATLGFSMGGGAAPGVNLRTIKLPRQIIVDAEGRFFLPSERLLEARSIEDGSLLWHADLDFANGLGSEGTEPGVARPEMRILLAERRVIAFLPETSSVVAIDAATGKLIWKRQLDDGQVRDGEAGVFSLNSGASYENGRLFVYGRESLILNADDGTIIWRFDGGDVRTFPISLAEIIATEKKPAEEAVDSTTPSLGGASSRPGYLDHLTPPAQRKEAVKNFLQYQGALVAPAVHWSAARLAKNAAAAAEIAPGDHLLLFGEAGVRAISLRLPLASQFHPIQGVYVGTSGSQTWFLDGAWLRRLDLKTNQIASVSLAGITGEKESTRAVLSGGRLYAMGERGIRVFNAWDGDAIAAWGWPASLEEYRKRILVDNSGRPQPGQPSESYSVWQGLISPHDSTLTYCLPVRDLVEGDTLYSLVGENAVVALREASSTEAVDAPKSEPKPSPTPSPAEAPVNLPVPPSSN